MVSVLHPESDSTPDPTPCDEPGGTVGVPPDTIDLRCQRPAGHVGKHFSSASRWFGQWSYSDQVDPSENH